MQRALAAWPDISKSIALPGSKIQSGTADLWGWRARLKLARGQTIADVTARIPAIELALGTYRGAVRVYPTGDGKANRCELRVLDTDPHAAAIGWPGPSARSIAEPVDLGPFEDAEPCRVLFLRRHALFAGTTGSSKSGGVMEALATGIPTVTAELQRTGLPPAQYIDTGIGFTVILYPATRKAAPRPNLNSTELRIYDILASGQKTVAELQALLGLQPANLSG